jgi:hypothetical protein
MVENEIHILRKEIDFLKTQIADLKATQDKDFEEVNRLIRDVYTNSYQYIADIHDYLWPVIHKLFPKYAESQKQIDAFMKRRSAAGGDKRNP